VEVVTYQSCAPATPRGHRDRSRVRYRFASSLQENHQHGARQRTSALTSEGLVEGLGWGVAVDANGAGLKVLGHAHGSVDVLGEDSRVQTVYRHSSTGLQSKRQRRTLRVVGQSQTLLLGLELVHNNDGAKDLLLVDTSVVGDIGEDGGLEEEALASLLPSSMYLATMSRWISSACGPMVVDLSSGSPCL
jgi:hypothetical protein